jgi:nitrogen fixation NifU-like protein
MTTAWDKFQELIKAEMLKKYSETMVEHSLNPRNLGHIDDADGFGRITGPCGDTMSVWFKIEGGVIANATFATDGCGTTIASGSMITEMAKGKSPDEVITIEQQDVLDALGGLPEESEHCALLAANTLKEAVKNYREKKGESAG